MDDARGRLRAAAVHPGGLRRALGRGLLASGARHQVLVQATQQRGLAQAAATVEQHASRELVADQVPQQVIVEKGVEQVKHGYLQLARRGSRRKRDAAIGGTGVRTGDRRVAPRSASGILTSSLCNSVYAGTG